MCPLGELTLYLFVLRRLLLTIHTTNRAKIIAITIPIITAAAMPAYVEIALEDPLSVVGVVLVWLTVPKYRMDGCEVYVIQ